MFKHLVLLGEKSTSRSEPENQPKTGWVLLFFAWPQIRIMFSSVWTVRGEWKHPTDFRPQDASVSTDPRHPGKAAERAAGSWRERLYPSLYERTAYITFIWQGSRIYAAKLWERNFTGKTCQDKMICSWKQWKIKWKNTRNILNVLAAACCILLFCKVCETKCIMQWCFKR